MEIDRSSTYKMSDVNMNLNRIINHKVLVFDLETTGLLRAVPFGFYPDYKINSEYNSSRIVSVAWYYSLNYDLKSINDQNINYFIRKPENDAFPKSSKSALEKHRITMEIAQKDGIPLNTIFDKGFGDALRQCDYIVGHNVLFDIHILLNELWRLEDTSLFNCVEKLYKKGNTTCTAKISRPILKIWRSRNEYKLPSLSELFKYCFPIENNPTNMHNAKTDVFILIRCINHMLKTNIVGETQSPSNLQISDFTNVASTSCLSGQPKVEPKVEPKVIQSKKFPLKLPLKNIPLKLKPIVPEPIVQEPDVSIIEEESASEKKGSHKHMTSKLALTFNQLGELCKIFLTHSGDINWIDHVFQNIQIIENPSQKHKAHPKTYDSFKA